MIRKVITGIAAGFLNGFLGSGGGTVIIPSLKYILKTEEHKAHATAILIILPLSILSFFIYFKNGYIDIILAFKVATGSIFGSILGAKILKKLSTQLLKKIFGIVLIFAAVRMLIP
ncbi:MAG: sulfite exporter TauE/SafE family protein [Peptostreptococcales bacterium]